MNVNKLKNLLENLDEKIITKLPIEEKDRKIYIRRLNKLKRDPKLFFEDSFNKRSSQVKKHLPIKYSGNNDFTIVSAVYNVEKYLEDIHNQDGSILLNSYLDFDYDGFYIIGPYASSETKHETVGQKWYNYSSYPSYLFNEILLDGDTTDEILQQLVFMKDERIINVATVQRKDGDFVHLEKTYYKIDQLFINTKNIYVEKN